MRRLLLRFPKRLEAAVAGGGDGDDTASETESEEDSAAIAAGFGMRKVG